jgi:hypothetical protein
LRTTGNILALQKPFPGGLIGVVEAGGPPSKAELRSGGRSGAPRGVFVLERAGPPHHARALVHPKLRMHTNPNQPSLVMNRPSLVVTQPLVLVNQPSLVVNQPSFVVTVVAVFGYCGVLMLHARRVYMYSILRIRIVIYF